MSRHLVFDVEALRDRCDEVNPIDAQQTVKDLTTKLNKYDDLYALAAPQIGIKERVICIKYNNGVIKEYINPMILESSDYHYCIENDISIPEKRFITLRPNKIRIRYQIQTAKPEENIDGVALDEDGLEIDNEWNFDELSDKDKKQLINYLYPKFIKQRAENSNKLVDEDKDAKELKEAMEFMKAVDEGKVKFDLTARKNKNANI